MEDVANEAGVSRALMYRYFPDKLSLFAAVVDTISDRMIARTAAAIDPAASPFERARAGVLGYLDAYAKYPHTADAIIRRAVSDPRLRDRDQHDRDRLTDIVVAQIRGLDDPRLSPDADALLPTIVAAWLAFTEECVHSWVHDPSTDRFAIADLCAYALTDAVARLAATLGR